MWIGNKTSVTALASIISILLFGCAGSTVQQTLSRTPPSSIAAPQAEFLMQGQWDPYNRQQLNLLIAKYGKSSANYNPAKPPYVVFDFDNTSVFLDIEEATLIYQLEHLSFKLSPAQLDQVIRRGIASQNFTSAYNNAQGQAVNIDKIAADIGSSYAWLYQHYQGLNGKQSLAQVQQSPHYQNFITKMRYLYAAIGDTFAHEVSYPWVTYLFSGMTEAEVRALSREAFIWQQSQPIQSMKWQSPDSLAGQAGVVSVTWENGLRPYAEMQNLYQVLQQQGFVVYIVSASFIDVIKEMASNPLMGFNVPSDQVYAMQLQRDAEQRIVAEFRHGYAQTQGVGKSQTIEKFLVAKYGYGPLLIAGDSEGDQNMMQDFADTQQVLIINRLRKASSDIGKFSKLATEQYQHSHSKYLLQGRDANSGRFMPSQSSLSLGATQRQLLRP
jgi:phosphoserine phosphatase